MSRLQVLLPAGHHRRPPDQHPDSQPHAAWRVFAGGRDDGWTGIDRKRDIDIDSKPE